MITQYYQAMADRLAAAGEMDAARVVRDYPDFVAVVIERDLEDLLFQRLGVGTHPVPMRRTDSLAFFATSTIVQEGLEETADVLLANAWDGVLWAFGRAPDPLPLPDAFLAGLPLSCPWSIEDLLGPKDRWDYHGN